MREGRAATEARAETRKRVKGKQEYEVGEYVIVHRPRTDKLDIEWNGPYRIVEKVNEWVYELADLRDNTTTKAHVNRLHTFIVGDLNPEKLLAEACKVNEYYVERVDGHERRNKLLWFKVKWLGYPEQEDDDPDAWVSYDNCKWSPTVKAYMRKHHLKP